MPIVKTWSPGFLSPDGKEYRDITNLAEFCREHNLNKGIMYDVYSGALSHHRGWTKIGSLECILLSHEERAYLAQGNRKPVSIWSPGFVAPDGTEYRDIPNLYQFCKEHNIGKNGHTMLGRVHREKNRSYKGWKKIGAVERRKYRSSFSFLSPDGKEYTNIPSLPLFCKEHGLPYWKMYEMSAGKYKECDGWTVLNGESSNDQ